MDDEDDDDEDLLNDFNDSNDDGMIDFTLKDFNGCRFFSQLLCKRGLVQWVIVFLGMFFIKDEVPVFYSWAVYR